VNTEHALSPCDIVQREFHHFAGAQAVGGNQKKHRVVAQPDVRLKIKRLQQFDHHWPGQRSWELLEAVETRCVDLFVQPWRDSPIQREEPQQSAQCRDFVLEASTAEPFACLGDENLDVFRLKGLQ